MIVFGKDKSILELGDLETSAIAEYLPLSIYKSENNIMKHWLNRQFSPQENQGFTLIELLVVMMTMSILAAIALPSFLSQGNKAKQTEAKQYVGGMNRAQQLYFMENATFADSIGKLSIGIKNQTENYDYTINIYSNNLVVTHNAVSKESVLKSYAGVIYLTTLPGATSSVAIPIVCESQNVQVGTAQTATSGACPNQYFDVN